MKQLLAASLIGCVALAGCADVDEGPAESGWSVGGETTVGMSADCAETVEPSWFTEQPSMWYQPSFFGFSPNSGLLLRADSVMASAVAYRAADGEEFYAGVGPYSHAVDAHWRLEARGQAYTNDIDVVDRATDEVLATVELGDTSSWVPAASFGPQGELFTVFSCVETGLRVSVWSIADDASVLDVELDTGERCNGYYSPNPEIAYTPDAGALVLTLPSTGELVHVDLREERVTSVLAHEPAEGDHNMLPVEGILDLAVHPTGEFAATSGVDGKVRFWTLPGLEPVGEPLTAGVAAVNLNTYAPPHRVSPLEWTPDGRLLAMMSPSGDMVLRERTGETVSTLVSPEFEGWIPEGTTDGIVNPPMAIAFDENGRIGVGSYLSAGIWTCGEEVIDHREGGLDAQIELEGPEELRAGRRGVFHARVEGADAPMVMRLVVDGEQQLWPQRGGSFNWHAYEPGTYHVVLEVDDGTASATREMTVEVTPDTTLER
ncbi:WD40 repeat domain-containing protein [Persicimonas caeni]|uniref:WD40 repeat domain-containing protein n=1 Tax=Persicimonas caeni TaxID=2292766 RepID=A0A4Y6Q0N1_PERCE|nr:WD40 repeat domain-containing protein [Persicimonas caeni]QDG53555.1 WD40 repeat domain-containing protein [Persicimonas caeni]QED34776.1 WD40 repeat domain-containing protein [Persicimonas caeni]